MWPTKEQKGQHTERISSTDSPITAPAQLFHTDRGDYKSRGRYRLWSPTEVTDPECTTFPRLSLTPDSPLCLIINVLPGVSRGHPMWLQAPLSDLRRKPVTAKDKLRACTCELRNAPSILCTRPTLEENKTAKWQCSWKLRKWKLKI